MSPEQQRTKISEACELGEGSRGLQIDMKPYYYVYRYQNQSPSIRHATLELAQAEAERLAAKHPGTCFEILKAVGLSQVRGPASTFFMDGELPGRLRQYASPPYAPDTTPGPSNGRDQGRP